MKETKNVVACSVVCADKLVRGMKVNVDKSSRNGYVWVSLNCY